MTFLCIFRGAIVGKKSTIVGLYSAYREGWTYLLKRKLDRYMSDYHIFIVKNEFESGFWHETRIG